MKKIISIFCLALLAACSPSMKGESQQWENAQKDLAQFTTNYTGFQTVIDDVLNKAKSDWQAAEALTDEKEKAKKFSDINDNLRSNTSKFTEIKYKQENLQKGIDELNALRLDKKADAQRNDAVTEAMGKMQEIATILSTANPASLSDAQDKAKEAIKILISTQGLVDRTTKAVKGKK